MPTCPPSPIGHLLTQVVGLRARVDAGEDGYGAPVTTHAAPVEWCARVEDVSASEVTEGSDVQVGDRRVFLPAAAPLGGRDLVVHEGGVHEVVGEPAVRNTPAGPHHLEALIRRVQA